MPASITVRPLDANTAIQRIQELSNLLIDCVEGGASVSFMAPLARDTALHFWRGVAEGVARHERILLIAENSHGELLGTVQLITALPENQPHRADIAKMLVYRHARRQGIGAALLDAADQHAMAAGKTLLVLDTVSGGDGERLYARAGWQRVGDIPGYALYPDGRRCATTYFYKDLGSYSTSL